MPLRLRFRLVALVAALLLLARLAVAAEPPLRVLLAGLAHGHAGGFLGKVDRSVLEIAGVWEPDDTIWAKYRGRPQLKDVPRFASLDEALTRGNYGAVWAFSDTRSHLAIVRAAAPKKLSVIVEKPLAVSWADAAEIARLATTHGTLALTNYETSWYPSFSEAKDMLAPDGAIGTPRQIYMQAGHPGPIKINVGPEFLVWLRDPARAGGGALFDFGCYGANLATWWLGNRAPLAVSARTSQFDRASYPDCDDHATIVLDYGDAQVTCVGSWHWPYSRKDAALYGDRGSMVTANDKLYTLRTGKMTAFESREATTPARNALRFFADTVRAGRDPVEDPSSLANNLIVMRILDAARRSAAENRTVLLSEYPPVEKPASSAPSAPSTPRN